MFRDVRLTTLYLCQFASDLGIMDMWANYTCIILAEEDSKESWNVQNKEDINPISVSIVH